eukprot:11453374-Alexandrium_andersonii.AAC.1
MPFPGPCSSRLERLKRCLACSVHVGNPRFDRFDSLLGSIGSRCPSHNIGIRAPRNQESTLLIIC